MDNRAIIHRIGTQCLQFAEAKTCNLPIPILAISRSLFVVLTAMNQQLIYPRHIISRLHEALEDSPVVLIHGARQCGKTTLAQSLSGGKGYSYINFDDQNLLAAALADPAGFVAGLPDRIILDEIQRVPEIFTSLKMAVDERREPGRFILTGSANVLTLPRLSDSLAGRMAILHLHPLSQAEIERSRPDLLARLFTADVVSSISSDQGTTRQDLLQRVTTGGYPPAIIRPNPWRRIAWYQDYVETLVQRDVKDLTRIRGLDMLPALLRIAAGETARLVRISEMASRLPRSRPTIDGYVTLLEQLFLIEQLPAWSNNRMKRLIKTPKLHIGDTGLACGLLGLDPVGLQNDAELLGQIFETFIYQELRRHASWETEPTRFFHYRDRDQVEVDLVLERSGEGIVGIEAKTSGQVSSRDFRGLRKLAAGVGKRFRAGVVFYTGNSLLSFGEHMFAVPVSELWAGNG